MKNSFYIKCALMMLLGTIVSIFINATIGMLIIIISTAISMFPVVAVAKTNRGKIILTLIVVIAIAFEIGLIVWLVRYHKINIA